MAKTTAPLLSFGASGQIGSTLVYGSWKGRDYTRRYVIPANPQSTEQTLTRNCFSFLQSVYKVAPSLATAPWAAYARGKPLTDRNAFTKFNLPLLRDSGTLDDFVASPGALGGLPPTLVASTPGSEQLQIDVTAPSTLPTGWTIAAAVAMAIREQDPDSGLLFEITAGEDTTSTYQIVLTGLTPSVEYQYRAYLRWTRPDGLIAYSPALGGQDTPTA